MRVTKPATFHIESASHASAGELVMAGLCFESFSAISAKCYPTMNITAPWHSFKSHLSTVHLVNSIASNLHTM